MFEVGDVALAVSEDECPFHAPMPEQAPEMIGKYFRVTAIREPLNKGCVGAFTLAGAGGFWCQGCFRKVTRASESFTLSIKRHADEPVS